jgi:protein-disulfide isomerase
VVETELPVDTQARERPASAQLERDEELSVHVEATPTFFLNGRRLEQIQPIVDYFAAAIDEELKRGK